MATLPDDTSMGPVELTVADLATVLPFYTETVGLEVLDRTGDHAHLGIGSTTLYRLSARSDAPARRPEQAGLFHVAVLVPDRRALAVATRRLRESGRMTGASDHLVSEAVYARDPEGNGLEIYRDRPRDEWQKTPDGGLRIVTWPLDLEDLDGAAPADADTRRVPAGARVGHVHLEVTDLADARAFYVATLGFDLMAEMEGALFVSAGGYHHHLGLNVWNRRRDQAGGRGLDRFHILLPERNSLDAAVQRLEDGGYGPTTTDGGNAATVTDPAGIDLVLSSE